MTEDQWLTTTDPWAMLNWITKRTEAEILGATPRPPLNPPTLRKLRLWACALCREVEGLIRELPGGASSLEALAVAERYADGLADGDNLHSAYFMADAAVLSRGWDARDLVTEACETPGQLGSHWLLTVLDDNHSGLGAPDGPLHPGRLADILRDLFDPFGTLARGWHVGLGQVPLVRRLARASYDDRDWTLLPVLADALGDAGLPDRVPCPKCKGSGSVVGRKPRIQPPWKKVMIPEYDPATVRCDPCKGRGTVPNPLLAHLRAPCPWCREAGSEAETPWSQRPLALPSGADPQLVRALAAEPLTHCACKGTRLARHARGCAALDLVLGLT